MTRFIVPMTAEPQRFSISMAGVTYQMLLKWNVAAQCWVLDISDVDGNAMVCGIPLVTGADLLEQFAYLNFGGQLICETDGDINAIPTFTNLGTQSNVYFIVP